MKKIINGKLYDTDTARKIDSWSNMQDVRNFGYFHEELYRKRTGEYFIYGEGGPMTHYAKRVDSNSWSGGEAISPLTYEKAREWAEEHMDADDYAAEFGMPSEDAEGCALNVTIPAQLMAKLRQTAASRGMTLTDYVVEQLSK